MQRIIFVLVVLFLCIDGWGCAPAEAPRYFSIDADFEPADRETVRAAVEAWAVATDSRIEETLWSERGRFMLVDDLPEDNMAACPEGRTCAVNATNDGDNVWVARNRTATGLAHLWHISAHEWGHFCIDGHRESSTLMTAVEADEPELVIDDRALHAWYEGCP